MISENLKIELLNRAERSSLDFRSLVSFMENSEYHFIGAKIVGALGIATYKKAYFNMFRFMSHDDQYVFFVILHEYCHMLAVDRIGLDGMIKQFQETDVKKFTWHFIKEEILADRFARFWFYKMNKKVFPYYRTQQLECESNQKDYENNISELMGKICDEETYFKNLYFFVKDWRPIHEFQPIWYEDVELLTNDGKIRNGFHRLQGDDNVYYGTLDSNEIIYESDISHWRELKD